MWFKHVEIIKFQDKPTYDISLERSSKSVSWSDGGWKTLCIRIGFCEPTRAKSREGSSRRRELSGYVVFDSDWLTKLMGFSRAQFWLADNSGGASWFNVLKNGAESMY